MKRKEKDKNRKMRERRDERKINKWEIKKEKEADDVCA